jgi:hypothetical protein
MKRLFNFVRYDRKRGKRPDVSIRMKQKWKEAKEAGFKNLAPYRESRKLK